MTQEKWRGMGQVGLSLSSSLFFSRSVTSRSTPLSERLEPTKGTETGRLCLLPLLFPHPIHPLSLTKRKRQGTKNCRFNEQNTKELCTCLILGHETWDILLEVKSSWMRPLKSQRQENSRLFENFNRLRSISAALSVLPEKRMSVRERTRAHYPNSGW